METLKIIIGESASATPEIIEKYGFGVIPFKMTWEGSEQVEGENIFQRMRRVSSLGKVINGPKTSQPSLGIYKKFFEDSLKDAENVLYICLSSKLSGAYNSAIQAHKMMSPDNQKRVVIFDTQNADCSEAIFAIRARELYEQGLGIIEIVKELELLKEDVKLIATLETSTWLEAGGRINHALSVMIDQMQKLGMRPVLMLKDGEIKPAMLKMQAKDPATALLKALDDIVKGPIERGKKCRIIITHGDNEIEAEKIRISVTEKYGESVRTEFIGLIGPVIGAHVGPGSLICCITDK
jgi:DegV family protein with EDD domain